MKKIVSFTVAIGIMASLAATAAAAETEGAIIATPENPPAVTDSAETPLFETIITPEALKAATPQIILTQTAPFYWTQGSPAPAGWLAEQIVDTTGAVITDESGHEWREIYTWLGKAWIQVPATANVVTP